MAARRWHWLALVAAAVLMVGAYPSGAQQGGKKDGDASPWMVKVSTPVSGIIAYVATPLKKGEKAPPGRGLSIAGIEFRRLAVGDKVTEGQVLVQVDDRLAERSLEAKQAKLAAADIKLLTAKNATAEARLRLDTVKRLHEVVRAVSQEEVTIAQLKPLQAQQEEKIKIQEVAIARTEAERGKLLVDMHQLRSPVNGVIRAIYKVRGEGVHALDSILLIEETMPKE